MPGYPEFARSVATVEGSVYSKLAHRLATHQGEIYPLHVGDTFREPPVGSRMQDLTVEEHPGMHRYSRPHGSPALLEAIALRLTERTGLATSPEVAVHRDAWLSACEKHDATDMP